MGCFFVHCMHQIWCLSGLQKKYYLNLQVQGAAFDSKCYESCF